MMSRKELLKTQQSVLQREMAFNADSIAMWGRYLTEEPKHKWAEDWKGNVVSLHKKQYALSKLLKSVEQEIRWEADKLRLMKEVSAIAQEQGEYE